MQDANTPLRGCAFCADLFAVASLGPNQTLAFLTHRKTHDVPVPTSPTREFPDLSFLKETHFLKPEMQRVIDHLKLCRQLLKDLRRANDLQQQWNDSPFVNPAEAFEYKVLQRRAYDAGYIYRTATAYTNDDQPVEQLGLFPRLDHSDDTQHNGT